MSFYGSFNNLGFFKVKLYSPEVVGTQAFDLRGMQTTDQMAKRCQINNR